MTDAVEKRYEEAVQLALETHPMDTRSASVEERVTDIFDAIGFRALLEIKEAAREVSMIFEAEPSAHIRSDLPWPSLARLRAALAARATDTGDSESPEEPRS